MNTSGSRVIQFFETLVIFAIVLVLAQTFLEDYAVLAGWSWPVRKFLIFSGFGFDLFFTLEFLIRFFSALSKRRAGEYFFRRRGWIDFFASIPLILFNSGPMVLALLAGGGVARGLGGVFNVLKLAKAVRIARILRLLRVLKVLKQIKYAGSVMAQRHTAKLTTVAITATVFTFFVWSLLESGGVVPRVLEEEYLRAQRSSAVRVVEILQSAELSTQEREVELSRFIEQNPNILIVKRNGETEASRYSNREFTRLFGPVDYGYLERGAYSFYLSRIPLAKERSKRTLLLFMIILAMVLSFLLYYSSHFAITVSDPLLIMRRGFSEPGYKLEVKIPERYRDDDLFRLAKLYNEEYLPLKERMGQEEGPTQSDLSLADLSGFLGSEEDDTL